MMLYHGTRSRKCAEVRRVLKKGGLFYCATYGEHGMVEYLSKIFSVPENDKQEFYAAKRI